MYKIWHFKFLSRFHCVHDIVSQDDRIPLFYICLVSLETWVSQIKMLMPYSACMKGFFWFYLVSLMQLTLTYMGDTAPISWIHIKIVSVNILGKQAMSLLNEGNRSKRYRGLLPLRGCCHTAAAVEKAAAWISFAVRGKKRAQRRQRRRGRMSASLLSKKGNSVSVFARQKCWCRRTQLSHFLRETGVMSKQAYSYFLGETLQNDGEEDLLYHLETIGCCFRESCLFDTPVA